MSGAPQAAAKRTATLITDSSVETILEATFLANGYIARADMLTRGTNGWMVGEVKSALKHETGQRSHRRRCLHHNGR